MTKIVYNACYGGFGLSAKGLARFAELKGLTKTPGRYDDFDRADPVLVQVVEELGADASDGLSKLRISEVPDGTRYRIDEYDGNESVMTVDDYDWKTA